MKISPVLNCFDRVEETPTFCVANEGRGSWGKREVKMIYKPELGNGYGKKKTNEKQQLLKPVASILSPPGPLTAISTTSTVAKIPWKLTFFFL